VTGSKFSVCGAPECRVRLEQGWMLLVYITILIGWTVFRRTALYAFSIHYALIHLRFWTLDFSIGIFDFMFVRHSFVGLRREPAGWRALYSVTIFCKEPKVVEHVMRTGFG